MTFELFTQFVVISLLAFGGGQAALPLMERVSVAQMGWVNPAAFAAAVAFGYITPGPVLIVATFIGYMVAGVPGAIAATLGAFLAPTALAAGAAAGVERLSQNRWLRAFGLGAAPAVVGLLAATTWNLTAQTISSWPLAVVAVIACLIIARTKIAPGWILLGSAMAGWMVTVL